MSLVDTPATTHYNRAGLVWVKDRHMLLRMAPLIRTLYFEPAIAHCVSADLTLFKTLVSQTPMFTLTMRWDDGDGQGVRRTCVTCMTAYSRVSTALVVRAQRRWRRARRQRRDREQRRAMLAMGAHPRLGRASPLYALDEGVLQLVASFV